MPASARAAAIVTAEPKRQIIDDAPEKLAICQFDCRKGQCLQDEWETCDRRIRKGAGELFPDARLEKPHQFDPARSDKAEDIPDQTTEAAAERKRKIV
jgi:hypothetical protein